VPSVPIRAVVPVGVSGMAAERLLCGRLPVNEAGRVEVESKKGVRQIQQHENPNSCICTRRRLSVLVEIEDVAHEVTKCSAIPILLETAARASPIFAHGWGIVQASLTDRSKDEIPGSCRSSSMQRAGYVAGGCLGRGRIGLWEEKVLFAGKRKRTVTPSETWSQQLL